MSRGAWLALLYLIVAGSIIGFTAYVWLIHHESPTKVGTYAYVNPVVAVLVGYFLGGETLGLRTILGTLFVCRVLSQRELVSGTRGSPQKRGIVNCRSRHLLEVAEISAKAESALASVALPDLFFCFLVREGNEFVAESSHRYEVARIGGLVLDIFSQAHDEIVDRARVGILLQIPHIFQDRFSGNGMARVLDQVAEQFRFHQGQLHGLFSGLQAQVLKVDDFIAKSKCVRRTRAAARRAWPGAAPRGAPRFCGAAGFPRAR